MKLFIYLKFKDTLKIDLEQFKKNGEKTMEHKPKIQMIIFANNANKYLGSFIKDIENSPMNAYEDLCEARNEINKVIDCMFNECTED